MSRLPVHPIPDFPGCDARVSSAFGSQSRLSSSAAPLAPLGGGGASFLPALCLVTILLTLLFPALACAAVTSPKSPADWIAATDDALVDSYLSPADTGPEIPLTTLTAAWTETARKIASSGTPIPTSYAAETGRLRARLQQALVVEMAAAVARGDLAQAKALRVDLPLPRGVSSVDGALLLQTLGSSADPAKRADAAKALAREAVTWQTTRARTLLDEAVRSTQDKTPMPRRLLERLAEAATLADVPQDLLNICGVPPRAAQSRPGGDRTISSEFGTLAKADWASLTPQLESLRKSIESGLPSLLSDAERERRERLLLKLLQLTPKEYASGVRDGAVTVPLEYREAVTFTRQARQILGELSPLWLSRFADKRQALETLESTLDRAEKLIGTKAPQAEVVNTFESSAGIVKTDFGVSLRRSGTTADIVDEVMVETRSLLNQSLAAALAGKWAEAEQLRLEAYTTFDPDLESRLLPRDPQLALDIERLLLDGIDKPGVKALLDNRAPAAELQEAFAAASAAMDRAAAMLKSGVSPTAAVFNASSIVLREGIEGLLVIVAIFAGLRGPENASRRRWFWVGILGSVAFSLFTWVLSQTIITSLHAYGEVIEAVTGVLAVGVLLLITNWLFQQVYWRQWVTSLKSQATVGSSRWQIITAGFLVGYREGFETVLFLQGLAIDAGGTNVGIGVAIGAATLILLGFFALKLGMKLPYYHILLVTAVMIGAVLLMFVGTTARAFQTVGWLPVHRLLPGSWPVWMGSWMGLFNTVESVAAQLGVAMLVVGTWRWARWKAKAKGKAARERRLAMPARPLTAVDTGGCRADLAGCCSLATLGVGCCGKVLAIEGESELQQTLRALGLSSGEVVECVFRCEQQAKVEFKIRGATHTLTHADASRVLVLSD